MTRIRKLITDNRGEGMLATLLALIPVIGTLALFITWYVINVNQSQLQSALNLALKQTQIDGYVSSINIANTQNYLKSVGLPGSTITVSPQATSPLPYGTDIKIVITASTMPLPRMGAGGSTANIKTIKASGDIVSQYVP